MTKMFYMEGCPYCKMAFEIMKELDENPIYKGVIIEKIEENKEPEKTVGYDYYYVPTFFVGDEKVYEASSSHSREFMTEKIEEVYRKSL